MAALDFGGGLRAAIAAKGWRIADFARRAGVQEKNLYEQMKRNNVKLETVERYAITLGISTSKLIRLAEAAGKKTS